MKFLVVLALAVFAGCDGRFMSKQHPKHQVDMVKDAFWDYVAKATLSADDSLKQIRQSELGKDVNILISESTKAFNQFTSILRTRVAPLTQDLMSRFAQEAERLKVLLEKDLTAVGTGLQPYAQELVSDLQKKVEELKNDATPYAEAMDAQALKTVVLQKSQELKAQLDKSMTELQAQMVPYTEEVREKMEKSLEEFQRSMIPMAQSFQTQLTQKAQEIQQNLAPYGEELKAKLDSDAQNLKKQLAALWKSFTKLTQ